MTELTSQGWFAAVGDVFAQVDGIKRVYGVKGAATDPKVVPMSSELVTSPLGVLGYGGAQVTPGSWERQTHTLNAAIWIPVTASSVGSSYEQAVAFIDAVMNAFPPRSKAGNVHPELAAVLVTAFEDITQRTWGEGTQQRDFVVLPFSIQVVRNRAAQYQPG
jgi:hypothetical protein